MKNYLIVGGGGFIGSALINKLTAKNAGKIYVLMRDSEKEQSLKELYTSVGILYGDLCYLSENPALLSENDINTVIHLASSMVPSSSIYDYQTELVNIVWPTSRLIEQCARLKIKFVYVSSGGAVYGNVSEKLIIEETHASPISYYGISKLVIEKTIIRSSIVDDLNYLILRPSNPYGPGQRSGPTKGLIQVAIDKANSGQCLEVWGDGGNVRDYLYIDDLSNYIADIVSRDLSNEIVNIGSGIGYTINQIIQFVEEITEKEIFVTYRPRRPLDVNSSILSIDKLHSLSNYRQIVSIYKGISECAAQARMSNVN